MIGTSSAAIEPTDLGVLLSWPSPRGGHTRPARWVAIARAGVGLCCLGAPRRLLPATERDSLAARRVMRVLGARHLVQAGVEMARPTPAVLALGAGVDAVHALSCLGFAVVGGARWRRGVLLNALGALGFCAATAITAAVAHNTDTAREQGGSRSPGPVRALTIR
jgi:hypothetical protein